MWSHGIGRHDPRARAERMRDGEFVVVFILLGAEAEGDERKAFAGLLGHDYEAELFQGAGEVVRCAGQVRHDRAVTVLSKADKLVVLPDDLGGAFGEVEGEGGLVSAQVVDVEDKLLG